MSEQKQKHDLYLSYSGRKCYLTCPKQYEYKYIKKELVERDPRDSLFGSIIGTLFEWFYEKQIYKASDPTKSLLDLSENAITQVVKKEKWDESLDPILMAQIRAELRKYVPSGLEVIRQKRFLTSYSRAEADLTCTYMSEKHKLTLCIGGRCDFIHTENRVTDVTILDGKASKHREKYIDPEQLIWYATQHYIKYHVAPRYLGFIFWKFPEDPLKYIDYDEDSVRSSLNLTFDVATKIKLKMFNATPSDNCKLCDYSGRCEEGLKWKAAQRIADGSRIVDSMFDLEQII